MVRRAARGWMGGWVGRQVGACCMHARPGGTQRPEERPWPRCTTKETARHGLTGNAIKIFLTLRVFRLGPAEVEAGALFRKARGRSHRRDRE